MVARARPAAAGPRSRFVIDDWLDRYQSSLAIVVGPEPYEGGRRWILRDCPFNREHVKPAVLELAGGALVYACLHESCKANDWKALRRYVDPDYREWTPRPQATPVESQEAPAGSAAEASPQQPAAGGGMGPDQQDAGDFAPRMVDSGAQSTKLLAVLDTFQRWLYLPDAGPLLTVLGCVAGNLMQGDPVWLPPSAHPEVARRKFYYRSSGCQMFT